MIIKPWLMGQMPELEGHGIRVVGNLEKMIFGLREFYYADRLEFLQGEGIGYIRPVGEWETRRYNALWDYVSHLDGLREMTGWHNASLVSQGRQDAR